VKLTAVLLIISVWAFVSTITELVAVDTPVAADAPVLAVTARTQVSVIYTRAIHY